MNTARARDVVLEIDLTSWMVTLYQSGPWAEEMCLRPGALYEYQGLLETFAERFVDRDDRDAVLRAMEKSALLEVFSQRRPIVTVEARILLPDSGAYEWYRVSAVAPIGGRSHCAIQNMQREKERELHIAHRATHDCLTDWLNRAAFEAAVRESMAQGPGALLILDIDNFKDINDTLGHLRGDEIICALARGVRGMLPEDAVPGRFGGDEFTAYLPGQRSPEAWRALGDSLADAVHRDGLGANVTVSAGMSLYPAQAEGLSELLLLADRALYCVKQGGKNGFALFEPRMREALPRAVPRRPARPHGRMRGTLLALAVALALTGAYLWGLCAAAGPTAGSAVCAVSQRAARGGR